MVMKEYECGLYCSRSLKGDIFVFYVHLETNVKNCLLFWVINFIFCNFFFLFFDYKDEIQNFKILSSIIIYLFPHLLRGKLFKCNSKFHFLMKAHRTIKVTPPIVLPF